MERSRICSIIASVHPKIVLPFTRLLLFSIDKSFNLPTRDTHAHDTVTCYQLHVIRHLSI